MAFCNGSSKGTLAYVLTFRSGSLGNFMATRPWSAQDPARIHPVWAPLRDSDMVSSRSGQVSPERSPFSPHEGWGWKAIRVLR